MEEFSTHEARIVAQEQMPDIYHKELILWLCDQVDEYYRIEQQRVAAGLITETLDKDGVATLTRPAMDALLKNPIDRDVAIALLGCNMNTEGACDTVRITKEA